MQPASLAPLIVVLIRNDSELVQGPVRPIHIPLFEKQRRPSSPLCPSASSAFFWTAQTASPCSSTNPRTLTSSYLPPIPLSRRSSFDPCPRTMTVQPRLVRPVLPTALTKIWSSLPPSTLNTIRNRRDPSRVRSAFVPSSAVPNSLPWVFAAPRQSHPSPDPLRRPTVSAQPTAY